MQVLGPLNPPSRTRAAIAAAASTCASPATVTVTYLDSQISWINALSDRLEGFGANSSPIFEVQDFFFDIAARAKRAAQKRAGATLRICLPFQRGNLNTMSPKA